MSDIPEEVMRAARNVAREAVERPYNVKSTERAASIIARALMAERKRALEEAAKVAEDRADAYAQIANKHEGTPIGESNTMRCGAAAAIAAAIRKLGEG